MKSELYKSPRLYVSDALTDDGSVALSSDQSHYLMTVMRKEASTTIRLFNGRDGEFVGKLAPVSKKAAAVIGLTRMKPQPQNTRKIHLYFAPIKKDRLQFLIEKAVELGATDLHPILTDHTENRAPNMDKVAHYIVEAAEQCERMDMPTLHPLCRLETAAIITPTFAAMERVEGLSPLNPVTIDCGLLIGPEGGWSEQERTAIINDKRTTPVTLGESILRAETAALFMLSRIAG